MVLSFTLRQLRSKKSARRENGDQVQHDLELWPTEASQESALLRRVI
jgi:hypothetical protein